MKNHERYNPSAAALWASAFVILALIIVQAGKLPGNQAFGDMATTSHGYTLLTTNSGRGPDESPYQLSGIL